MYKIWKLPKLLFRAKVLTKFSCDLWPFDPKCIGIFLSPSCIYVWTMKAVCWRQLKLSCQNQSVDQVHLWPWPLTPKCIGIFLSPSCIYVSTHHPTSMYEIWRMYVENYSSYRVRTKVLTKFHCDIDLWPFDPKMYRYLPLTILHLCMKYERCTLKTTQIIVLTDRRTKGARLVTGP